MQLLRLIDARTGSTLDTVGVDQTGATCTTGEAAPVLSAYAAACAERGMPAPTGGELVDALDGWTDGARTIEADLPPGWTPPVPNVLLDLREAGSDRNLRKYWTKGDGAARIAWGTSGDFTRCVSYLDEHVSDPEGLCAEYHKTATGMWPGDKRNK